LLIDADPVRIAGVSATDGEKDKAREVTLQVRAYLQDQGWPDPIVADSGNGFHLLYDVDLPVDDGELVKRVLGALAGRFDTAGVKIDRAVFNPSRIVKLYGTQARKSDSIPDRPHRWTAILEVPPQRRVVPKDLLERVADGGPAAQRPEARDGRVRGEDAGERGAGLAQESRGAGLRSDAAPPRGDDVIGGQSKTRQPERWLATPGGRGVLYAEEQSGRRHQRSPTLIEPKSSSGGFGPASAPAAPRLRLDPRGHGVKGRPSGAVKPFGRSATTPLALSYALASTQLPRTQRNRSPSNLKMPTCT
jgi:hypothetical protein